MTSMMSYPQQTPPPPHQRPRQLSFASTDDDEHDCKITITANKDKEGNKDDNWQQVTNRRKPSFDESKDANNKTPKSKAARKNERRRERKRREKLASSPQIIVDDYRLVPSSATTTPTRPAAASAEVDMEEELCLAIAESSLLHENSDSDKEEEEEEENDEAQHKKLRNLRKKLTSAQRLQKQQTSSGQKLDSNQVEKIKRIPQLQSEISQIEEYIRKKQELQREKELQLKKEADAKQQKRIQQWIDLEDGKIVSGFSRYTTDEKCGNGENYTDSDEFACPICAGPLEAATWAIPCKHVFCRACLENAIKSAAELSFGDPASCACPLCRTCLYDVHSGMVRTRKADTVRRKMKKRSCTCRCGTVINLTGLREHLRVCGSGAPELFGDEEKKKFGHEFEQPVLDEDKIEALRRKEGISKKNSRRMRSDSVGSAGGSGRGRSGSFNNNGGGGRHVSLPQGYDEAEAYQRALLLSLEEQ